MPCDLSEYCALLRSELETVTVPKNHHRTNILSEPHVFQRSLLLGAFTTKGCGVTTATTSPKFARVLSLAHGAASCRDEKIPYSGIMINISVDAEVHRDASNVTLNDVLVIGDFMHGDIVVECAGGSEIFTLADGSRVEAENLSQGRTEEWLCFDATRWHKVQKADGVRMSVVLFCSRGLHRLSQAHWSIMEEQ
eukprot:5985953-Amphidinium_carterae.1